jgi:hypothetical protein
MDSVGDITVSTLSYATGALGPWYLGSSSPTLVDAGCMMAGAAGLYHHTTQTNQTPEGATIVDLGFHYVAVDANGLPLDYDGDGIPDYLEDTNGNGSYDSATDLSDWQTYNSPNGLAGSTDLRVFTPLKP